MAKLTILRPHDGLALVDGQLWTRAVARKSTSCLSSGAQIRPGDAVYRPAGNGNNRMYRILASVVEQRPIQQVPHD